VGKQLIPGNAYRNKEQMILKTFLIACAAAFLSAAPSICLADDAASTNATATSEMKTNGTAAAQSAPAAKAEKKKKADKKKAAATQAATSKASTNAPAMKPAKQPAALQPISGPASPLSADKQKRLADILAQYRADKITPQEYHAQRAKILAEP
jgi:hypothetical protein